MNRLDRRMKILAGKRDGAFDQDQYWFEKARRERVARRVRSRLRRMEPMVLVTPRWSKARRFLDDVATDLQLGEPSVRCRTLSLLPLAGRSLPQSWAWLVAAVTGFCNVDLPGPAWQAVSGQGFRAVMSDLLARAEDGPARCLMIHGLEHLHVEALTDLISVFDDHVRQTGQGRRFNLLLAGTIDASHFEFEAVQRIILTDFSDEEAREVLVEHMGPVEHHLLDATVGLVGGVPAILDQVGELGLSCLTEIAANRDAVWKALGTLAVEIRAAFDIVASDDELSTRLEALAAEGVLPELPESDYRLIRTGLIKAGSRERRGTIQMRAPVFADLALAG